MCSRGGDDTDNGVSGRIYGMLAAEMSDTRNRGRILWVFATSRPDLLEWSDEADALIDEPLVGMERYVTTIPPFDALAFADVETVRAFLTAAGANRAVWSDASLGAGMNSTSHTHGDFDNDPTTLDSVAHILRQGF